MIYSIRRFSDLEDYEVLDDKKLKKLTENQIRMILEDERNKARRNTGRIVSKRAEEEGRKGKEEGAKRGKKRGTIAGGIIGALGGGGMGLSEYGLKGAAIGAGIGGLGGALLGRLVGKSSGAAAGYAEGRARGAAKGRKEAKEQGHDEIDVTTKNARIFDEYARKRHKKDSWEIDFRNQLKEEKRLAEEAARKLREEELARRRVEAEEKKAKAEELQAETDRDRYWDDFWERRR